MLNRHFQESAHVETNMLAFFVRALIIFAAVTAGCGVGLSQTPTGELERPVARLTDHAGRTVTIRYVDVLTQLALQPGTKIDPPQKDDFEQGLQTVLNQRILETPALEEAAVFGSLPSAQDIDKKLNAAAAYFPSVADLESRIKIAGFLSVKDENFRHVMTKRLIIEWYVDNHFSRCARPTQEIEERYYHEVFKPEFRRRQPGLLIPTLDEVRRQISDTITKERISDEVEKYLMRARQRVQIEILDGELDNREPA